MTTNPRWPDDDVSQVPFGVYADPEIYAREQDLIFRGPVWHFLCLEAEIEGEGDYKVCEIGEVPVIAVRTAEDGVNVLVNRCAHKGALVCYKPRGTVSEFTCVYHNWTYDLDGALTELATLRNCTRSALIREAIGALTAKTSPSFGDLVGDLVGSAPGPADLSTSSRHMKGFGE